MFYIQRMVGRNKATLETVDEFTSKGEARDARYEYAMADRSAVYYISPRPCKAWRDKDTFKGKALEWSVALQKEENPETPETKIGESR